MSYLSIGFVLWLCTLAILWFGVKMGSKFVKDGDAFDREVSVVIKEMNGDIITTIWVSGIVSVLIVIGWPIIGIVLGLAVGIGIFGGLPYLIIRSLKNKVK